jgi:hypothetical protein
MLVGRPKGKRLLDSHRQTVHKIIFKMYLKKYSVKVWIGFNLLQTRYDTDIPHCKELLGFTENRKCLGLLNDY